MKNLFLLLLTAVTFGCSSDVIAPYTNEEFANDEFSPYLESFVEEGKRRGLDFSGHLIYFYFADISYQNAKGLSQGDKIVIDRSYWRTATATGKEWLIFHELGHSILNRKHKNDRTETGECLSIMKGKENEFTCSTNFQSSLWRTYYLDELFEETSPLPSRYFDSQSYEETYSNKKELIRYEGYLPYTSQIALDTVANFLLEVNFSRKPTVSHELQNFTAVINLNGNSFLALKGDALEFIRIRDFSHQLFENNDIIFKDNVKLSIRKKEDFFSFFVDEKFQHLTEMNSFENSFFSVVIKDELEEDHDFSVTMFAYD